MKMTSLYLLLVNARNSTNFSRSFLVPVIWLDMIQELLQFSPVLTFVAKGASGEKDVSIREVVEDAY